MTTTVSSSSPANCRLSVAILSAVLSSIDAFQSHGGPKGVAFQEPSFRAARNVDLYLILRPKIELIRVSTSYESCEQNSRPSGRPHRASTVTRGPFGVAMEKAEA